MFEYYNHVSLYFYNILQLIALFSFTEVCIHINVSYGDTFRSDISLNYILRMRMYIPTYRYQICPSEIKTFKPRVSCNNKGPWDERNNATASWKLSIFVEM